MDKKLIAQARESAYKALAILLVIFSIVWFFAEVGKAGGSPNFDQTNPSTGQLIESGLVFVLVSLVLGFLWYRWELYRINKKGGLNYLPRAKVKWRLKLSLVIALAGMVALGFWYHQSHEGIVVNGQRYFNIGKYDHEPCAALSPSCGYCPWVVKHGYCYGPKIHNDLPGSIGS